MGDRMIFLALSAKARNREHCLLL
uniref:Uncharacterized protein n=1 Tax=Anguilla anguilla TaxID=7936 RepID=A0A0E9TPW8_ANGAN